VDEARVGATLSGGWPGRSRPVRRGRARTAAVALAVGLLIGTAGCSREVEGVPAAAGGAVTTSAPTAAATAASPTTPADPVEALRGALLTPADLGPGWTIGEEPVPDASAPTPCGGPGVVAQFPDAVRVGTVLVGPEPGFLMQETLSVYADVDTAEAAFAANELGLECGQGSLDGSSVVIAPAEDLQFDVGGDQALGWRIGAADFDAVLVSVQVREGVVTFIYVSPVDGDPAALPDVLEASRTGVDRILAA
jgi:hypothetical protein